jgi:hypothetical protein
VRRLFDLLLASADRFWWVLCYLIDAYSCICIIVDVRCNLCRSQAENIIFLIHPWFDRAQDADSNNTSQFDLISTFDWKKAGNMQRSWSISISRHNGIDSWFFVESTLIITFNFVFMIEHHVLNDLNVSTHIYCLDAKIYECDSKHQSTYFPVCRRKASTPANQDRSV